MFSIKKSHPEGDFFLNTHARGSPQCRQYRRCNRSNQLNDKLNSLFLCHSKLILVVRG